MHWIYLAIAVVFEIAFALGANAAKGFTKLWPSVFTLTMATGGIFFLSLTLVTIDVSVGYAIWTGLGSIGIVLLGALIFKEKLDWRKLLGFLVIIIGIIGLRLTGA